MSALPPSSARAVRPRQLVALLLAFVLAAGTGGVLVAGLVMPAVGAAGTVATASTDLFEDLPSELAIPQPSQQSVMLAADGSQIATFYLENRIVVGLDQISEHVQHAVVAVEDRRFYTHKGIDTEGMLRAAANNVAGGQLEGASTLTQQYVKNVLIEAGRVTGDEEAIKTATETSLGRKLREARLAIGLEEQVSKDDILEGYLNIAQFGPSVWGVEAAARHYFNASAADLGIGQAALLAGITQSPARWDPVAHPDNAEKRRNEVLGDMLREGYITQQEYEEAVAVPVPDMLDVQSTPNGCNAAGIAAYFCEYVVKDLMNNESWGKDRAERSQMLMRGGLTIHTTLDLGRQQAAYDSVVASVPVNDPSGIKMAMSLGGAGHRQDRRDGAEHQLRRVHRGRPVGHEGQPQRGHLARRRPGLPVRVELQGVHPHRVAQDRALPGRPGLGQQEDLPPRVVEHLLRPGVQGRLQQRHQPRGHPDLLEDVRAGRDAPVHQPHVPGHGEPDGHVRHRRQRREHGPQAGQRQAR